MEIRSITSSVQPGLVTGDSNATQGSGGSATPVSGADASTASVKTPAVAETPAQQAPAPTLAQLTHAVDAINKSMETMSQGLVFAVDADSHRTVVKVIDQKTNQVIRQIPSKLTLDIAQSLDHWQGLLIKEKA